MIAFAEVAIGSGALPTCASCGPRSDYAPRSSDDIVAELERVSAEWTSGPGPNVSLCGGEALAHPGLPQLVVAARGAGFERIRLVTSAAPLSAHGNAEGALQVGVRHLEVVVLGSGDDHDAVARRPGEFAAVRAGLEAWRAASRSAGVKTAVVARVPVCRHNLERLGATAAGLSQLGVLALTFDVAPEAAGSVRAASWLGAGLDSATTNGVWATVYGADTLGLPPLHRVSAEAVRS